MDDWEAYYQRRAGRPPRESLQKALALFAQPGLAVELPACDLVNASFSLPFCMPEEFDELWGKIGAALSENGRFAGHFFGNQDGWSDNSQLTFHTADQVQTLLAAYEIEWLQEREYEEKRPNGEWKHWHLFAVVARKKAVR